MKRWAVPGALVVLALAAHGPIVREWWMWDDTQLLYAVVKWPLKELFFSPPAWQAQTPAGFVPALLGAFKLDYVLFGLSPRAFYVHHLAIFIAAMLALYAWLRHFTSEVVAGLATAAAILAPASFTVGHLLMNRHYVEGLLFAMLAMLCFLHSDERPALSIAGAAFYFLACIEKEMYPALPLLVIAQDLALRRRLPAMIRNVALCSVSAIVYLLWRIRMLGSLGGFGLQRRLHEAPGFIADIWSDLTGFESPLAATFVALLFLVLAVYAIRRWTWRAAIAIIAAIIVIGLPLLALRLLDHRHVFAAVILCLALAACAVADAKVNTLPFITFAALCIAIATAGMRHFAVQKPSWEAMQRDGKYLWEAPPGSPPIFTVPNGWYVEGVRWLREHVKEEQPPLAIASVPGLVLSGVSPQAVTSLNRDRAELFGMARDLARNYIGEWPLVMRMRRTGKQLAWVFGPDAPGTRWYFLAYPARDLIQLAQHGELPLPSHLHAPSYEEVPDGFKFRILRVVGEKWTATPELQLPRGDGEVVWIQPQAAR